MRVLIISDVFIYASKLALFLERRDIKSEIITNPTKNFDKVKEAILKEEFNCILLDLNTNNLVEVLTVIKSEEKVNIPIIVLGNNDSYETVVKIVKLGISKYLKKPLDVDMLYKSIRDVVAQPDKFVKVDKKGSAIFTRTLGDVTVVTILGQLEDTVIHKIDEILKNSKKIVISLNGVSSLNVDKNVVRYLKSLVEQEGSRVRLIVIRESIKKMFEEEGYKGEFFSNEFFAIKNF